MVDRQNPSFARDARPRQLRINLLTCVFLGSHGRWLPKHTKLMDIVGELTVQANLKGSRGASCAIVPAGSSVPDLRTCPERQRVLFRSGN